MDKFLEVSQIEKREDSQKKGGSLRMKQLTIKNYNGVNVTDSKEVADMIGKRHDNLLRDIQGYIKVLEESSKLRSQDFFIESTYKNSQNKIQPCYLLTKQGCEMVANKMTGEKGILFTAEYVQAFNKMEEYIKGNIQSLNKKENPDKDLLKEKEIEARYNNSLTRKANLYLKIAAINPNLPKEYVQVLQSKAAETLNDGNMVIPLPKAERKTYTAAEIGEKFGISANKVGRLANANNLKADEFGLKVWDKSKYSAKEVESFKYYEEAIPEFERLLNVESQN